MTRLAIAFVAALIALQDKPAAGDRVFLGQREEIRGELMEFSSDGALVVKQGDKTRRVSIEEVTRVTFEEKPELTPAQGDKVRLQQGGQITGTLESYEGDRMKIVSTHGTYTVARGEIKSMTLGPVNATMPEFKEDKKDIVILAPSAAKKSEMRIAYGRLASVTADTVKIEGQEFPRSEVRVIHLEPEKPRGEIQSGLFARIMLKNGDRVLGTLRTIDAGKVGIFSHYLGSVVLDKRQVHSITFAPLARMSTGNLLVSDQTGIKEFDREGKLVWTFTRNVAYAWSARKLENGNVLVANTNVNQVLEIRPTEKSGGDVVWQLDGVNFPYDAQRLDNGNTLVVEYYANKVVEYDKKDKSPVWTSTRLNYPISAERLPSGNTLICSHQGIVEVDAKGAEVWRASVPGLRPWRATRLENGNTLITEQSMSRVIEVDSKSNIVWKKAELGRPAQAIRLDDGNTLILEQQRGQIIEVDPTGKTVRTIPGLEYPLNMSTY